LCQPSRHWLPCPRKATRSRDHEMIPGEEECGLTRHDSAHGPRRLEFGVKIGVKARRFGRFFQFICLLTNAPSTTYVFGSSMAMEEVTTAPGESVPLQQFPIAYIPTKGGGDNFSSSISHSAISGLPDPEIVSESVCILRPFPELMFVTASFPSRPGEAGLECALPPGWSELGCLHHLLHALLHFFG
jgi:hypothetical protein